MLPISFGSQTYTFKCGSFSRVELFFLPSVAEGLGAREQQDPLRFFFLYTFPPSSTLMKLKTFRAPNVLQIAL